jgi:hypothetical protein
LKRENFYRRNPNDALAGMVGMSLEERGVYNTVIDLLYSTWRPVEDNRAFIANWCGCAVQKLNPIIERLIGRGKLVRFEEGGASYLSNSRFESERSDVKGSGKTRSGRQEVEEKSAGVGEKSAGVGENPALLNADVEENQPVRALEKSRVEESRETPIAPKGAVDGGKPKITLRQADVEAVWSIAPPKARERSSRADVLKALQGAARRGNHPAEVMVGVSAYYASREATRNDGEYAKGVHRIIIADRWKDFIPAGGLKTQTDPSNWPNERWRVVLDRYKVTGKWPENAGPSPENEGTFVPDMLKGSLERAA